MVGSHKNFEDPDALELKYDPGNNGQVDICSSNFPIVVLLIKHKFK